MSNQDTIEREYFSEVYDALCELGGASMTEKESFVDSHLSKGRNQNDREICFEWRFCGDFGFGGKYRRFRNTIDYYREDETDIRNKAQEILNHHLEKVYKYYKKRGLELEIDTE